MQGMHHIRIVIITILRLLKPSWSKSLSKVAGLQSSSIPLYTISVAPDAHSDCYHHNPPDYWNHPGQIIIQGGGVAVIIYSIIHYLCRWDAHSDCYHHNPPDYWNHPGLNHYPGSRVAIIIYSIIHYLGRRDAHSDCYHHNPPDLLKPSWSKSISKVSRVGQSSSHSIIHYLGRAGMHIRIVIITIRINSITIIINIRNIC